MVYGQVRKPMGGVDLERRLDELQRRLQSMIELKTGWAEPHQKSRELQRLFRLHDMDATGTMSLAEFSGVLLKFNIGGTDEEVQALFDRFDINENGLLSFQEFGDGLFGLKRNPLADAQCRDVLSRVQTRLLKRTNSSMRGFSRSVRVMDRDRSGNLAIDELRVGLQRCGCDLSEPEVEVIMAFFDRDGSGTVSIQEFVRAVRGPLSQRRKELVAAAFAKLDRNGDGTCTLKELAAVYDASQHPQVVKGTKSEEDVLREFSAGWDKDGDGSVSFEEFEDYYKDVSAAIDSDEYFELMMRNVWHLAGGAGVCANTANMRVLVSHKDGTQSVHALENDLGVRAGDTAKIKAQLVRQGVTDMVSLRVSG